MYMNTARALSKWKRSPYAVILQVADAEVGILCCFPLKKKLRLAEMKTLEKETKSNMDRSNFQGVRMRHMKSKLLNQRIDDCFFPMKNGP